MLIFMFKELKTLLSDVKVMTIKMFYSFLFHLFYIFPLKNKVVATSFNGLKYEDSPRLIIDAIHEINPDIDLVWLTASNRNESIPGYIRKVPFKLTLKTIFEMATAKVWVSNNLFDRNVVKRKGQIYIETWHGGLGIKKIVADVEGFPKKDLERLSNFLDIADVFISNSDHLSSVYRSALGYRGAIWKCGYPKNDHLCGDCSCAQVELRKNLHLDANSKILVFAPTFRQSIWKNPKEYNVDVYNIDYKKIESALCNRFSGNWIICVRWHPALRIISHKLILPDTVIDVTDYPNMEELVKGCNAFLTDYSSCAFDAAFVEKPCFLYTPDFDEYKKEQGVYYELENLPFYCASNNIELAHNILSFSEDEYKKKWISFKQKMGVYESGHASYDIANVICEYMKGNIMLLNNIKTMGKLS